MQNTTLFRAGIAAGQRLERQLPRELEQSIVQHLLQRQTGCTGDGAIELLRRRVERNTKNRHGKRSSNHSILCTDA